MRIKQRRKALSILQLLRPLADQFVSIIETHVERESRLLAQRWLATVRSAQKEDAVMAGQATPERANPQARRLREHASGSRTRVMRRARPFEGQNTTAAAPDPAQAERTAELNRLRQILRPASETSTAPSPLARPAATNTDAVRSLENDIRDEIAFLPGLPPDRCAARIAVWAGKARIHQAHPTDRHTRIAAGLLLKMLGGLARAMDVGHIDALAPGYEWDWARYVALNEAAAAGSVGNGTTMAVAESARDEGDEFSAVWK